MLLPDLFFASMNAKWWSRSERLVMFQLRLSFSAQPLARVLNLRPFGCSAFLHPQPRMGAGY